MYIHSVRFLIILHRKHEIWLKLDQLPKTYRYRIKYIRKEERSLYTSNQSSHTLAIVYLNIEPYTVVLISVIITFVVKKC